MVVSAWIVKFHFLLDENMEFSTLSKEPYPNIFYGSLPGPIPVNSPFIELAAADFR
jgi:hypothetical protein